MTILCLGASLAWRRRRERRSPGMFGRDDALGGVVTDDARAASPVSIGISKAGRCSNLGSTPAQGVFGALVLLLFGRQM